MSAVRIEGLDRAEVLVALFNAARIVDELEDPEPMTIREARTLLGTNSVVGKHRGRVLGIRLRRNATMLDVGRYDSENGWGKARRVIKALQDKHP